MDYEQALQAVHSASRIGARAGFARIRHILKKLGDPQNKVPFIHVAGTNGKGSTCAMTASILKAAGYKVGLFVSPYVSDFRERIQCDGELISKEEFTKLAEKVFKVIEQSRKEGFDPTEFEIDTILALCWYADIGCDAAVLEVGLGGRLDPTNVIPAPMVCAITSISLDHTAILGDTVEQIAAEKSGIIKTGSRCAVYPELKPGAREVVLKTCLERGVPSLLPELSRLSVKSSGEDGSEFVYDGETYRIGLVGRHQIMNALTAIAICRQLNAAGFSVPQRAVREGLENVSFTGRLETVRTSPLAVIDGAHNPAKIASLCRSLKDIWPDKNVIAVMGMSKDKDYKVCIEAVARQAKAFIAVEAENPRALSARTAALTASAFCAEVKAASSMREAAELALGVCGENDMIVACGSMYIIGDMKKYLSSQS